jgi:hypothetical protein
MNKEQTSNNPKPHTTPTNPTMGDDHVNRALCSEDNKIPSSVRDQEHIAYPETPSNVQAIFMVKICINFVDPVDDATIAPNGASSLRMHLGPYPPSRLHGIKPPRCTVVDTESDTPLHLRATSSQGLLKKDAPSGKSGTARFHRSIRETQI